MGSDRIRQWVELGRNGGSQERDEEGTTDRNRSYCCAKIIRIEGTSGERAGYSEGW